MKSKQDLLVEWGPGLNVWSMTYTFSWSSYASSFMNGVFDFLDSDLNWICYRIRKVSKNLILSINTNAKNIEMRRHWILKKILSQNLWNHNSVHPAKPFFSHRSSSTYSKALPVWIHTCWKSHYSTSNSEENLLLAWLADSAPTWCNNIPKCGKNQSENGFIMTFNWVWSTTKSIWRRKTRDTQSQIIY